MLTNAVMNTPPIGWHMLAHKVASPALMELGATHFNQVQAQGVTTTGTKDGYITNVDNLLIIPGATWINQGKGTHYYKQVKISKGGLLDINSSTG